MTGKPVLEIAREKIAFAKDYRLPRFEDGSRLFLEFPSSVRSVPPFLAPIDSGHRLTLEFRREARCNESIVGGIRTI